LDRLSHETETVGNPVLSLIRQLVEQTPAEVAKYIHWGATTREIQDNVAMLQMRGSLQLVNRHLQELSTILRSFAEKYRDTLMAGRTHLQHALPRTFGYKCAVYLSSNLRHLERLQKTQKRCMLAQFGGAS
ncbi:3-carboxy-cis,cis-muconate cycloisomerase, partial [Capronia coronata CBS 617.96]